MNGIIYLVILPLGAAFLIAALKDKIKNLSDIAVNLCALALLSLSLGFVGSNILVYKIGGWAPPVGISLVVDPLANFMLITVNLISFLVLFYSISYMRRYSDKWKFHSLFMLMLAGMNGVIISGDLFNLYVFLEIASISGYALVAFGVEPQDLEAAFKYLVMGALASIFILLGIGLLYSHTSTLNMAGVAFSLSGEPKGALVGFVSVLFLAGFGLKAALVPFHAWLPDAHSSAPAPVSATLSGVFIKTLGVYALARIFFNVLGVSNNLLSVLMVLGVISMAVGAFLAIVQDDIKRMFAYSSISQVGYIFFALGIGTPLAIFGGLLHLFNHAVFKSLLFLDAGAIEYATGTRSLKRLGGLNSRLPVTGFTSLLGSLSISGVPPFGGFWSKLIIVIAALQAGQFWFALVAVLVSIVTLAYYLKFQAFAFFGKIDAAWAGIREVPFTMKFSMIILAVLCVVTGLAVTANFQPFRKGLVDVLSLGANYKDAVLSVIK